MMMPTLGSLVCEWLQFLLGFKAEYDACLDFLVSEWLSYFFVF